VLKVPNMEEAVTFYTKGLNMQVSHEGRCVVLVRALG
jgi:catechol 2,3-dioxygenase-like lactoylglutathione lyase family enzyme